VTNTGVCPGGGVGNNRKCIDNSVAPNVFSIGVPLLIYASTFVEDTLNKHGVSFESLQGVMQKCKNNYKDSEIINICKALKNVQKDNIDDMIVAFKDIDEYVEIVSDIISFAINKLMGTIH
jgi:spore protease